MRFPLRLGSKPGVPPTPHRLGGNMGRLRRRLWLRHRVPRLRSRARLQGRSRSAERRHARIRPAPDVVKKVLRLVGGRLEDRVMVFSKSAEVIAVVAMMFPSSVFSLASPYGPRAWPPGDCLIHAIRLGAWSRAVRGRRLPAGYQLPSTTQHLCRIFRRRPNVSQDFAGR